MSQTFKKPKSLVCYICGREFGTASLEIHMKSCKKKWEQEEEKKPKAERRPLPQPPKNFDDMIAGKVSQEDMDSYNNDAFKHYNEKSLVPCPNCARTFLPERLDVHMKGCNKAHGVSGGGSPERVSPPGKMGGGSSSSSGMGSPPKEIKKPKSLMCYICGREFGTASLEIHLKSCKKKWEDEEAKKPKAQRRPVPSPPQNFDDIVAGRVKPDQMENYNNDAFKNYNEKALVPCPNCARTFLPDRLDVHLKSCNKAHGKAESSPSPQKGGMASSGGGGMGSPSKGPAMI